MFIQLIILPLIISKLSYITASRYGAYCTSDSDCDQHQKCLERICRCNIDERRFWTGEICAVCVQEFTVTYERCYQSFNDLKTWSEARAYCRSHYSDLFTWRNNMDEQFIRPVVQTWASSGLFLKILSIQAFAPVHPYISWAGATVASLNPYTVKWTDPDGLKLTFDSDEWCDPTKHAGYTLPKQPSSETRTTPNSTEREDCITYNFGTAGSSLLCLADDFCSQKYPYICEMNAASMKLANSQTQGSDDDIDFEQPPPPPLPIDPGTSDTGMDSGNTDTPSALAEETDFLSMTNIIICVVVVIILIIGAVGGYMFFKKKKENTSAETISQVEEGESSPDRPSFTSSVGDIMDE